MSLQNESTSQQKNDALDGRPFQELPSGGEQAVLLDLANEKWALPFDAASNESALLSDVMVEISPPAGAIEDDLLYRCSSCDSCSSSCSGCSSCGTSGSCGTSNDCSNCGSCGSCGGCGDCDSGC